MKLLNNKEFLSKLIGKTLEFDISYKKICKCCSVYDHDYTIVKIDVDFSSDMDGFSFYYTHYDETTELKNWIELLRFIIQFARTVDFDINNCNIIIDRIHFIIFDKVYDTYNLSNINSGKIVGYSCSNMNDEFDRIVYDSDYDSSDEDLDEDIDEDLAYDYIICDQEIIDFISEINSRGEV